MFVSVVHRRLLAIVAVAAASLGAVALSAAPASAELRADSSGNIRVLLTPDERAAACGSFQGSYVFSDGSGLDCLTGIATIPAAK